MMGLKIGNREQFVGVSGLSPNTQTVPSFSSGAQSAMLANPGYFFGGTRSRVLRSLLPLQLSPTR